MHHNIGVGCDGLLGMSLVTAGGAGLVHFHVLASFVFALFLIIVFFLAVLNVDLLTSRLRSSIVVGSGSGSVLTTRHLGVLALRSSSGSFSLFLLFLLFGAILVAVCYKVGFGLVRGELRRSTLFRIPVDG